MKQRNELPLTTLQIGKKMKLMLKKKPTILMVISGELQVLQVLQENLIEKL